MPFFKSLFCWQGFDNRLRFTLISVSCYLLFFLINKTFSESTFVSSVFLLGFSTIYLATTRRRLNDINQQIKWPLAPTVCFLITGLLVIFIAHSITYWLFFFSILPVFWLITYPSYGNRHYNFGYNGPVDLTYLRQLKTTNKVKQQRVEPTINNLHITPTADNVNTTSVSGNQHAYNECLAKNSHQTQVHAAQDHDIAQRARLAIVNYKYSWVIITTCTGLFLLSLLTSLFLSSPEQEETSTLEATNVTEQIDDFQHKITLPDNFSLMFTPNQGLVITWPVESQDNQELWSLEKAKGETSCKNITFNSGEAIRTYRVNAMKNSYNAYFSPLDTKELIKNVAFKNSFTLCGYKFSLKGSQSTLGKSSFYANLIEY